MMRFAVLVLAGIGLGALIFGPEGASSGLWFLMAIPFFIFLKIAFFGALFAGFARHRRGDWNPGYRWSSDDETTWSWGPSRPRRSSSRRTASPTESRSDTDRFEEWHRMAHAKEEVDSWAPEPE